MFKCKRIISTILVVAFLLSNASIALANDLTYNDIYNSELQHQVSEEQQISLSQQEREELILFLDEQSDWTTEELERYSDKELQKILVGIVQKNSRLGLTLTDVLPPQLLQYLLTMGLFVTVALGQIEMDMAPAGEVTDNLPRNNKEIYYAAIDFGQKTILIGDPIPESKAINNMRMADTFSSNPMYNRLGNYYTFKGSDAFALANKTGNGIAQAELGDGDEGQYWHYHPVKANGERLKNVHIFCFSINM